MSLILLVPGVLSALPCGRCFRLVGAGTGPLVLPVCEFPAGSCRCGHVSCRKKGNCRPLPALMAGDLYAFWVVAAAVAARRVLAADPDVCRLVRQCGHAMRLAMDGHRRQAGLTGSKIDVAKEEEYGRRVAQAHALVVGAAAGRQYLLRLRPEDAVFGAVLERAEALLSGEEVAALRGEIGWALGA